jgi:hypothetical protein
MIDIFVLLHGILEDCHTENQRKQGLACDKLIDDRISSPHLASSGLCSNPAPSAGRSIIISDQWYNSHDQWCSCPTYHTSTESYVIVMLGMFLQSHYLQFSWFGSGSILHTIGSPHHTEWAGCVQNFTLYSHWEYYHYYSFMGQEMVVKEGSNRKEDVYFHRYWELLHTATLSQPEQNWEMTW